jgi:hypothetical protein
MKDIYPKMIKLTLAFLGGCSSGGGMIESVLNDALINAVVDAWFCTDPQSASRS